MNGISEPSEKASQLSAHQILPCQTMSLARRVRVLKESCPFAHAERQLPGPSGRPCVTPQTRDKLRRDAENGICRHRHNLVVILTSPSPLCRRWRVCGSAGRGSPLMGGIGREGSRSQRVAWSFDMPRFFAPPVVAQRSTGLFGPISPSTTAATTSPTSISPVRSPRPELSMAS